MLHHKIRYGLLLISGIGSILQNKYPLKSVSSPGATLRLISKASHKLCRNDHLSRRFQFQLSNDIHPNEISIIKIRNIVAETIKNPRNKSFHQLGVLRNMGSQGLSPSACLSPQAGSKTQAKSQTVLPSEPPINTRILSGAPKKIISDG